MAFKVLKDFRDKFRDNMLYEAKNKNGERDVFESEDSERVAFLVENGFIEEAESEQKAENITDERVDPQAQVVEKATIEPDGEITEPKHIGGGTYELPNGEKVKGKEAALEAFKDLETRGD